MKTSTKILIITLSVTILFMFSMVFWINWYLKENMVRKSGEDVTVNMSLNQFDKINITGNFMVNLHEGINPEVKMKVDKNFKDLISISVQNKTLMIQSVNVVQTFGAVIDITYADIKVINLIGGVNLTADNVDMSELLVKCDAGSSLLMDGKFNNLTCIVSNGSFLEVSGNTVNGTLTALNGSSIQAVDLQIDTCYVSANGGSTVSVFAKDILEVEASGNSVVTYSGTPKITREDITGRSVLEVNNY